jgi:hypothetical protein
MARVTRKLQVTDPEDDCSAVAICSADEIDWVVGGCAAEHELDLLFTVDLRRV